MIIAGSAFGWGFRWETALVVLGLGVAKSFESMSDVFYGLLQQRERMDRIAKSLLIKGPLSLIALGAGTYFAGSVFWGVMGLALAWAIVLMAYDARSVPLVLAATSQSEGVTAAGNDEMKVSPRWEIRSLAGLAWLSLPLGIVVTMDAVRTNMPRYFIQHYMGE